MLPWDRVQHRIVEGTRRRFPDRRVRRRVQGVTLTLPWAHRLPDYAVQFPLYGQNLVAVARAIGDVGVRFTMVDVGANVGDSALQVLRAVDAEVLCVEGDSYWLPFLATNTAGDRRVHITHAILLPDDQGGSAALAPVRDAGTTRFVASGADQGQPAPALTATELRTAAAELPPVRLVKVDTDGYDARLMPGLAAAFAGTCPVLFFEFDPALARETGDHDPGAVWAALAGQGYERLVVWDNFGDLLGSWPVDEIDRIAQVLRSPVAERGYYYWDVAAVHGKDPDGTRIERALCP